MCDGIDAPGTWLTKKYLDEYSLQFRTVWQLYLTFYVAFITMNGGALGLTVQYVSGGNARKIIAATFIFQNVLAAGTAINIARYSRRVAAQYQRVTQLPIFDDVAGSAALQESPIPGKRGQWSGLANLVGHILFIALWVVVSLVEFRK